LVGKVLWNCKAVCFLWSQHKLRKRENSLPIAPLLHYFYWILFTNWLTLACMLRKLCLRIRLWDENLCADIYGGGGEWCTQDKKGKEAWHSVVYNKNCPTGELCSRHTEKSPPRQGNWDFLPLKYTVTGNLAGSLTTCESSGSGAQGDMFVPPTKGELSAQKW
jgi:hypothetical protein